MSRLTIRETTYQSQPGFSIRGTDPRGRSISIFCRTRSGADAIKAAVKAGDSDVVRDVLLSGR